MNSHKRRSVTPPLLDYSLSERKRMKAEMEVERKEWETEVEMERKERDEREQSVRLQEEQQR